MEPCGTPLPIQDWASIRCSGTQCQSPEMITHGLSWWIFGYYVVMVFCNSSCGCLRCLRRICQSFDGVDPGSSLLRGWFQMVPIFCRRCLNHRIAVCGILKRLRPSAVLKLICSIPVVLSLSTMVRPQQVILCWNEVFLQCSAYT